MEGKTVAQLLSTMLIINCLIYMEERGAISIQMPAINKGPACNQLKGGEYIRRPEDQPTVNREAETSWAVSP